jgi:hypothetical protein
VRRRTVTKAAESKEIRIVYAGAVTRVLVSDHLPGGRLRINPGQALVVPEAVALELLGPKGKAFNFPAAFLEAYKGTKPQRRGA